MTHHVFHVSGVEAKKQLVHTLASGTGRRILFLRTKHHARKLAKQLTEAGIPSVDLHGNLSQPARDRNLAAFTAGTARVLVATDIAARGVHVDDVELVVHIDPPAEHKATCTAPGAPPGPDAPVTLSPSCCPNSAARPRRCCAAPVSPLNRNRFRPTPSRCRHWSARWLRTRPRLRSPRLRSSSGVPLRPHRAVRAMAGSSSPAVGALVGPAPGLGRTRFRTGGPAGRTLDVASRHPSE